jgi:hypothetical protein
MEQVDLIYRTVYAELVQRSLDASFDADFPVSGNFVRVPVKGRDYWYFEDRQAAQRRRYVGPAADPDIASRVAQFGQAKDQYRGRRKLVSTLVREARLTAPERLNGDVVEALERAGFFRLRGVLVGTVAYQAYSGYLGVRLPSAIMQTGDADFAQFHSIASEVEDQIPSILDVLRAVDPTFRAVPHRADGRSTTKYRNATGYMVEFLAPNRGSDDLSDKSVRMPALGDTAAQPLRYMDFLIFEPVRAVLLHGDGVPVLVPAPERYAIHKLIVASQRLIAEAGTAKRDKDLMQATRLIAALAAARLDRELAEVYREAWDRGPQWRAALQKGIGYLTPKDREVVDGILDPALRRVGGEYVPTP